MIAITGKLQTRSYETKEGVNRRVTEIVADSASFCGDKSTGSGAASATSNSRKAFEADPEELPF